MIFIIFGAITLANVAWWRWADRRLRAAHYRLPRFLVGIYVVGQMAYIFLIVSPRLSHPLQPWIPIPVVAWIYLWSLLILPASLLVIGISKLIKAAFVKSKDAAADPSPLSLPSRRQVLGTATIAIAPLVTAGLVGQAMWQLSWFRVRSVHLRLPGLPAKLEGLRIAHVSDLHVGRYTKAGSLPRVVKAVNQLQADLVLFTGDLIDIALADLPRGIAAMKQIDPRQGMALIEGNHDLIENADEFDRQTKASGLNLLVDEVMNLTIRGERVQLLGARWGSADGNRRRADPESFTQSIDRLSQLRDPTAFPILMAHHPHAFDAAAAANFPLVLSGHTHGGQLMLTPQLGFGPMFYRYWSGLYQKGNSQLLVNNGVGNWFPLRVNAPAEIIEIILHVA